MSLLHALWDASSVVAVLADSGADRHPGTTGLIGLDQVPGVTQTQVHLYTALTLGADGLDARSAYDPGRAPAAGDRRPTTTNGYRGRPPGADRGGPLTATLPAPRTVDRPGRWRALGISQAAAFMALLDVSIVNVALPSIERGSAPRRARCNGWSPVTR